MPCTHTRYSQYVRGKNNKSVFLFWWTVKNVTTKKHHNIQNNHKKYMYLYYQLYTGIPKHTTGVVVVRWEEKIIIKITLLIELYFFPGWNNVIGRIQNAWLN